MRKGFIAALTELASRDKRIMLLTGDLGFMLMDPFAGEFPERFVNVGVAEQNMVGIATGLAEAGMIPFVYSITPFAVLRPYEFIRNGPIYHRLPVRIVGAGGGFDYAHEGISHYAIEDVGVLRLQPGMTVLAPADYMQAKAALLRTWDLPGPIYYRLGKDERATIPRLEGGFELGRLQVLDAGRDLLIIAMGSVAIEAAKAVATLASQGISPGFAVLASVNPPPIEDLKDILSHYGVVLTVETHYVDGGIGSLVSEVIAETGLRCRLVRCGVRSTPDGTMGSHEYLLHIHGLSAERLADAAVLALRGRSQPSESQERA
jgi:transketolase